MKLIFCLSMLCSASLTLADSPIPGFERLSGAAKRAALVRKDGTEAHALAGSLQSILQQADLVLAESERSGQRPSLQAEHAALGQLGTQLDAWFSTAERKLSGAGLSEKVEILRGLRQDYQRQFAEVDQQWRKLAVSPGNPPAEIRSARRLIARLRPVQGENLLPSQASLSADKQPEIYTRALATTEVTAEIRALAAQLGRDPAQIFAWVYNNVAYDQYRGYMQTAQSILWSRRANDFDQASLLIALLRAAGYQARYVDGNIRISMNQLMNWWGAKTPAAVRQMALTLTGVTDDGDKVRIDHGWVELLGPDGTWIPLDPSVKSQTFQPGIVLPRIPFDRTGFLAHLTTTLGTDWYLQQFDAYIRANHPGKSISDLGYKGTIVPVSGSSLPAGLPFEVVFVRARSETESPQYHHRVIIGLFPNGYPQQEISMEFNLAGVCLQTMTVTFKAATGADAATIAVFGGIAGTPAGLAMMVPQLRVDDQVVATGPPVQSGALTAIRARIYRPFASSPDVDVNQYVSAGESAGFSLEGVHISDGWIQSLVSRLVDGPVSIDKLDPDFVARHLLFLTGARYNQHVREERARITEALQYVSQGFRTGPVTVSTRVGRQTLFDRPFVVTPLSMTIGALGTIGIGLNVNVGNDAVPGQFEDLNRAISLMGVGFESQIFEEVFLRPGICATKGIQFSNENHINVVTFTKDNATTALNSLTGYPEFGKQLIRQSLDQGFTIIMTPVTPVIYQGVQWITYFAERADGGMLGQLQGILPTNTLTPLVKGGGTGTDPSAPQQPGPGSAGDPGHTGGTAAGDPVTISNGNMFAAFDDLFIPSRGVSFRLSRTYNSEAKTVGAFGYGWSHSYERSLKISGNTALLTTESGGVSVLTKQGSSFVSSLFEGLTMTTNATGSLVRSRHGRTWRFDPSGKLMEAADRNGNALHFGYSGNNLTSITDDLGRAITLTYDARNHVTLLRDFAGRSLTYTYDGADNLTSFTDPLGNTYTYSYYSSSYNSHKLASITDAEGRTVRYSYYADGKAFKVTSEGGGQREFYYLPMRNQTDTVDERGLRTVYFYDAAGRVTQIIQPDGNTISTVWNADGLLVQRIDEANGVTTVEYDATGDPLKVTDARGNVWRFTFDPTFHLLTSVTNPLGNQTTFGYDPKGNLLQAMDATGAARTFSYDSFGERVSDTSAMGATSAFTYDRGLVSAIQNPLGSVTKLEYDDAGSITRIVDAIGDTARFEVDAAGRMVRTLTPLGNETKYSRDRAGRLTAIADPNGNTTSYKFDALDNLSSVSLPSGDSANYAYTSPDCPCAAVAELRSSATNARGNVRRFAYNSRGALAQVVNANGEATQLSYDARGNLAQATYPDGTIVRNTYDATNHLVKQSGSDGLTNSFEYDTAGNLIKASNNAVTYTYTYDARNLLLTVQDSRFTEPIRYEHDASARLTRRIDPLGGVTSYTYDDAGRMSTITNPAGLVTSFNYDAAGRRTSIGFANGTSATYEYDADGRLAAMGYTAADATVNRFQYEFDQAGNRTAMIDAAGRHTYSYDAAYRLTAATHPDQSAEQYGYDPSGNRISSGKASNLRYDAEDRLINDGTSNLTYDRRGSLVRRASDEFTYDSLRQLTRVVHQGTEILYSYDPFGRRISKSANGASKSYLYDGDTIIHEYGSGNTLAARFTYGPYRDEPLILERDLDGDGSFETGEMFFYQSDALGSVRALSDSSGRIVERYTYDSFGNPQPAAQPSAVGNPYLFTGREWDAETGLYFYRARYYDPVAGRFLQTDALWSAGQPMTLNRYAYTMNNPVNFKDPSGNSAVTTCRPWQGAVKERREGYNQRGQHFISERELPLKRPPTPEEEERARPHIVEVEVLPGVHISAERVQEIKEELLRGGQKGATAEIVTMEHDDGWEWDPVNAQIPVSVPTEVRQQMVEDRNSDESYQVLDAGIATSARRTPGPKPSQTLPAGRVGTFRGRTTK